MANSKLKNPTAYRADIDGLRAVAVSMVVLYHAFPNLLPGGFVGVDIFFVISGFLITRHISAALITQKFSYFSFYLGRCRRLLPAFVLVVGCTWIAAHERLLPDEFKAIGTQLIAAAIFSSNIMFWKEAGYFDISGALKPLLHLWSLGVEEQFYLVWPMTLALAHKYKLSFPKLISMTIIGSFLISVIQVADQRTVQSAFFLLPGRFWEFMVGAGTAFLCARAVREKLVERIASTIGSLMILAAALTLGQNYFPGIAALLPVLGTSAFIFADRAGPINRVLAHKPFVFVGLISYPLYLWHWPLLSFSNILSGGHPSNSLKVLLVLTSFALAILTYWFVETPLRKIQTPAFDRYFLYITAICLTGIAVVGGLTRAGTFSTGSAHETLILSKYGWASAQEEMDYWRTGCFLIENDNYDKLVRNGCTKDKFPGRPVIALLGDSHAAYLSRGLSKILERNKINLHIMTAGWCSPLNTLDTRDYCREINSEILKNLSKQHFDAIIISVNVISYSKDQSSITGVSNFADYLSRRAEALSERAPVILLGQIPTWDISLPSVIQRNYVLNHLPTPERSNTGLSIAAAIEDSNQKNFIFSRKVSFVSLRDQLCDKSGCLVKVGPDLATDLIVFDYGHLTIAGADFVSREILWPRLQSILGR